jgi:hypothetical protein
MNSTTPILVSKRQMRHMDEWARCSQAFVRNDRAVHRAWAAAMVFAACCGTSVGFESLPLATLFAVCTGLCYLGMFVFGGMSMYYQPAAYDAKNAADLSPWPASCTLIDETLMSSDQWTVYWRLRVIDAPDLLDICEKQAKGERR